MKSGAIGKNWMRNEFTNQEEATENEYKYLTKHQKWNKKSHTKNRK